MTRKPRTFADHQRSVITGRNNQRNGETSERYVEFALGKLGLVNIHKIETGYKVKRIGGKIISAKPIAKVQGDFTAMTKEGLAVLVEVKRSKDKLSLSNLAPHQILNLNRTVEFNGIAILAWHEPAACGFTPFLMRWPIDGLEKGTTLKVDKARLLSITKI